MLSRLILPSVNFRDISAIRDMPILASMADSEIMKMEKVMNSMLLLVIPM